MPQQLLPPNKPFPLHICVASYIGISDDFSSATPYTMQE